VATPPPKPPFDSPHFEYRGAVKSRGIDDTAPAVAETLPAGAATPRGPIDSGAELVGDASLATARIVVPGYVVGAQLGAGGFGEVFRATHEVIGREVAIKVLHERYSGDSEAIGRFIAEARAVGKMSHPGIVDLFEFGRLADGRNFAVMELLRGRTLRDVLRDRGRLTLAEALPILRSMAEAIDAAHAAGIAHRDLKPDNVFVVDAERGVTKLIDFGLAKLTDEVAITQTGSVFGTPLYMSPEQCRGKGVDTRTDCYSFGAMAYHVLTGSPPFTGSDALALALQHLNESPDPPSKRVPELGDRVDRVLAAMLAKDPADRPMPIATAIDALVEGELPKQPPRPAFVRRHRGKLTVATAGLAIAVVAGVLFASSSGSDRGPECALAAERLDGVWDPVVRARLAGHFARVDRPDVVLASRRALRDLDEFATEWSKQWDAACHAAEKQADPLLYAQRQNCLERTLVDLRGVVASIFAVEPGPFAAGWIPGTLFTWSTPIADCARTETLRAMPAAPRPEHRQEVAELVTRMHLVRAEMRGVFNARVDGDAVKANARLDEVVVRLASLEVAIAAEAAMVHAWYAHSIADRDPAHLPAARRSSERAIALARRLGDDRVLALCYQYDAGREMRRTRDVAVAEDLLRRAREAHERSGKSAAIASFVGEIVGIASEKHDWNAVIVAARADGDLRLSVPALLQLARGDEAISAARSHVDKAIAKWGMDHWFSAEALEDLALVHYQLGNSRQALDVARESLATFARIRAAPSRGQKAAAIQLVAIHKLGLPDLEAAAQTAFETAPQRSNVWLYAAQAAMSLGNCDLAALALARVPLEHDPTALDLAAPCELVAQIDQIAKRLLAAKPYRVPTTVAEQTQPGFFAAQAQASVDATSGRAAAALAYLQRNQPAHAMSDGAGAHLAMTVDAQVWVALGRWTEALALLERAAKRDRSEQRFVDYLSWGRARLGTGDAAGAVPHLERALAASFVNDGYNLPHASFALARALWDSGGDRERARRLAVQAIRTYSTFHEAERRVAQKWLDSR
jgi:tetratricopeptide (TPR) repeat protein